METKKVIIEIEAEIPVEYLKSNNTLGLCQYIHNALQDHGNMYESGFTFSNGVNINFIKMKFNGFFKWFIKKDFL